MQPIITAAIAVPVLFMLSLILRIRISQLISNERGEAGGDGDGDGSGDGDGDGQGKGDLGDAGKKAIQAERQARKDADKSRKSAEDALEQAKAKITELEKAGLNDHEKAISDAVEEATKTAREESDAKWRGNVVKNAVKAAAVGKIANPDLAPGLISVNDLDPESDTFGTDIASAIDALVKDNPFLEATPKKPKGSGDGGPHGGSDDDENLTPTQRMRKAYEENKKK